MHSNKKLISVLFAALICSSFLGTSASSQEHPLVAVEVKQQPDRNVLWSIVDNCIDEDKGNYCTQCTQPTPARMLTCNPASASWDPVTFCKKTKVIWDKTAQFVAIMDYKMCGCADKNFIHGLVLPRTRVTGVEDAAHRPQDAWLFAWNLALKKITDTQSVILAANPKNKRSQDQLHIHVVRLAPGAREKLEALAPVHVADLRDVWKAAARHAAAAHIAEGDYGIAVVPAQQGGDFLVITVADSAEALFSIYKCAP